MGDGDGATPAGVQVGTVDGDRGATGLHSLDGAEDAFQYQAYPVVGPAVGVGVPCQLQTNCDGDTDGAGDSDGVNVGGTEGLISRMGCAIGLGEGGTVGVTVGILDSSDEGMTVGVEDGVGVGMADGSAEGCREGV